jgi:tetratricopeptide (TPR) repeat protein
MTVHDGMGDPSPHGSASDLDIRPSEALARTHAPALEQAMALMRRRAFDAAERCLREALAGEPENAALLLLLGQALREKGDSRAALAVLDQAASRDPQSVAIDVHRGLCQIDLGNHAAAIDTFETVAQRAPMGEHHRLLGLARRRANDFEGAARAFEMAAHMAPKDPAILVDLASIREELNQPEAALALLERGLREIGPHRQLVEAAIRALRRRGRHRDAAAWIAALLAGNPDVAWLHSQMASTLESFDRPRANAHFARARQLDPDDTRLLVAHADSLNRTRGPDEAENIAHACRLARARLETPGDLRRDARVLLGIFVRNADFESLARLGRFEELGDYYAANGQYGALHLLLAQEPPSIRLSVP